VCYGAYTERVLKRPGNVHIDLFAILFPADAEHFDQTVKAVCACDVSNDTKWQQNHATGNQSTTSGLVFNIPLDNLLGRLCNAQRLNKVIKLTDFLPPTLVVGLLFSRSRR